MKPNAGPRTALVLVDAVPPSVGDPEVFDRLGTVLAAARRGGLKVVHVWTAAPGAPPPLTHPSLEPRPGEPVLPNHGEGAWSGSDLAATLSAGGIGSVVLAGPATSPVWWRTLEQTAATPIDARVISDRVPEHDAAARRLLARADGVAPAVVIDPGDFVASMSTRPPSERRDRRRRVAAVSVVAVVALLAAGAGIVNHDAKGYYEFAPGAAPTVTASPDCEIRGTASGLTLPDGSPCARLVVPAGRVSPIVGKLFMVDVLVGPASPLDYVLDKLHLLGRVHAGNQLVPSQAVLGTTPANQLGCQDTQQMTSSTEDASVAALDRLGYKVTRNNLGALIVQVGPGTAADSAGVHCGDVVTAVGATVVHTAADLVAAIHASRPGARVTLKVQRAGPDGRPTTVTISATLTATPAQSGTGGSPASPASATPFLGVSSEDDVTYTLPFDVSIQVGDIGGPSAGLALTLGLLDVLSGGKLTGGKAVAATGTIAPDGTVGDVGGVAQKTIAVRRAGADVFLVPPQEYQVAVGEAGPHMKVMAVSNLADALTDLERLGGSLETPPDADAAPAPKQG